MFSVIIPIYIANQEILDFSLECIEMFKKDLSDKDELIVIDDCSPLPHSIKAIKNEKNMGVAATWNRGVGLATKEIVVMVNSDTLPFKWKPMADYLDKYDVVFPKIYNAKNSRVEERLAGEFFMFKRELIDKIGKFNEDFGSYFEDTDFFQRVLENGGKMAVHPDTLVSHLSQGTFSKVKTQDWMNENYNRNLKLYNSLHSGHPYLRKD